MAISGNIKPSAAEKNLQKWMLLDSPDTNPTFKDSETNRPIGFLVLVFFPQRKLKSPSTLDLRKSLLCNICLVFLGSSGMRKWPGATGSHTAVRSSFQKCSNSLGAALPSSSVEGEQMMAARI